MNELFAPSGSPATATHPILGIVRAWGIDRPDSTLLIGTQTPLINLGTAATTLDIEAVLKGDLTFEITHDHIITVETSDNVTTPGNKGGNLTVQSAKGGNGHHDGFTDVPGGDAGDFTAQAQQGGDGTGALAGGKGGSAFFLSGNGGVDLGGGGNISGDCTMDTGAATGSSTNGTLSIGSTNADKVVIGRAGKPVQFFGQLENKTSGNEQGTVGGDGSASALPAHPDLYLKIKCSDGVVRVLPLYKAS